MAPSDRPLISPPLGFSGAGATPITSSGSKRRSALPSQTPPAAASALGGAPPVERSMSQGSTTSAGSWKPPRPPPPVGMAMGGEEGATKLKKSPSVARSSYIASSRPPFASTSSSRFPPISPPISAPKLAPTSPTL
ncbi:hypothetical protein BT69DRAFT_613072 [Atractiella rhizophila]|nr:hypothetical protein BT69DRAFT_613072 [Atractiella rhizophila]